MTEKYPVVVYARGKRIVVGSAELDGWDAGSVGVTLTDSPWRDRLRRSINDFRIGLCQPDRDSPQEMVLSPKRAYPGN